MYIKAKRSFDPTKVLSSPRINPDRVALWKKAYGWIKWDDEVGIGHMDWYGTRPQLKFYGTYKGFKVILMTKDITGVQATLRIVLNERTSKIFRFTAIKRSKEVKKKVDEFLRKFLKVESILNEMGYDLRKYEVWKIGRLDAL